MAKILIVDDNAINRRLLVALLSYDGHLLIEADDGDEGVALAKAERPELVISDIVMPSMDGFGLVRELRADPVSRNIRVIFYTASYHEREAKQLASQCHVDCVIVKPCEPTLLLKAVEQALAGMPESTPSALDASFDSDHLLLITNKLAQRTEALESAGARMIALAELGVRLASEQDSEVLLAKACAGARNLVGSRFAVISIWEGSTGRVLSGHTSGIAEAGKTLPLPAVGSASWVQTIRVGHPWRTQNAVGDTVGLGLPMGYPSATSLLVVPLRLSGRTFGWLALGDKLGASQFDDDDERALLGLADLSSHLYTSSMRQRDLAAANSVLGLANAGLICRLDRCELALERALAL